MFANIQFLRAFAAIVVVMHHFTGHYQAMGGRIKAFEQVGLWGFAGVDVFFVISGFIMGHTTLHKARTWANARTFLWHRLARIYLGYWPFLALYALWMLAVAPQRLLEMDLLGSVLLTQVDMMKLLLPISWSLSFELYFYFLFALLFAMPIKVARIAIHLVLAVMILRISTIWIASGALHFFLSHFLVEFFAGAFLYIHHKRLDRAWMAVVFALVALLACKYGVDLGAKNNYLRVYTFGLAAFCLIALALTLEQCGLFRAGPVSIAIGDASYTIYLSHLLFLDVFYTFGLRDLFALQSPVLAEAGFFAYFLASLAVGVLLYQRVERPLYRWAVRPRRAAALLAQH